MQSYLPYIKAQSTLRVDEELPILHTHMLDTEKEQMQSYLTYIQTEELMQLSLLHTSTMDTETLCRVIYLTYSHYEQ